MPATSSDRLHDQLAALRTELVEQACTLERQGRLDAADVAMALSHRLGELSRSRDGVLAKAGGLGGA